MPIYKIKDYDMRTWMKIDKWPSYNLEFDYKKLLKEDKLISDVSTVGVVQDCALGKQKVYEEFENTWFAKALEFMQEKQIKTKSWRIICHEGRTVSRPAKSEYLTLYYPMSYCNHDMYMIVEGEHRPLWFKDHQWYLVDTRKLHHMVNPGKFEDKNDVLMLQVEVDQPDWISIFE